MSTKMTSSIRRHSDHFEPQDADPPLEVASSGGLMAWFFLILGGLFAWLVAPGLPAPIDPTKTPRVWELAAELAVIIGPGGRGITAERAMDHVWGYTIVNDITARETGGFVLYQTQITP